MSDDAVERRSDAELRTELQRRIGQLRRVLDDGTIDTPTVAPLVESLEERIDALEAQLEKTTGTFRPLSGHAATSRTGTSDTAGTVLRSHRARTLA